MQDCVGYSEAEDTGLRLHYMWFCSGYLCEKGLHSCHRCGEPKQMLIHYIVLANLVTVAYMVDFLLLVQWFLYVNSDVQLLQVPRDFNDRA